MINEDYVSFEIAKFLKEKKFDEFCYYYYMEDGNLKLTNWNKEHNFCPCPTLQMAMKWLRQIHNITISISFEENNRICHVVKKDGNQIYSIDTSKSYEEVCEEDIKFCLKFLI